MLNGENIGADIGAKGQIILKVNGFSGKRLKARLIFWVENKKEWLSISESLGKPLVLPVRVEKV